MRQDKAAPGTVRALDAAPASALIPADVHETVVAVAEQHTSTVTLNRHHEVGAFEDPEDGFRCGCDITLHTAEDADLSGPFRVSSSVSGGVPGHEA
ncbi:hypothetical protein ABT001_24885 [Streptomyces sp. NPDC002793]|uniref:hypothetical protein n=1 Tax=Streptomyces sp. NPDC002793 TaxID=3154432 RepID=UPI00331891C6